MPPATQTTASSDAFRAVADTTRRAILDELARGERSAGALCGMFDISQSAVSQHLRILRDAGLVEQRQAGRQRLYRLEPAPLRAIFDWVAHYQQFWEDRLDALARVLDEEAARRSHAPSGRKTKE